MVFWFVKESWWEKRMTTDIDYEAAKLIKGFEYMISK